MRILSKIEERELNNYRLESLKKQARTFLKEAGADETVLLELVRLFLLAQNYNAYALLPLDLIKKNLHSVSNMRQIVKDFRSQVRTYDKEIHQIVLSGMKIRHHYQPTYPSFFDTKDRIYVEIPMAQSGGLYLNEIMGEINADLPETEHLSVVQARGAFFVQSAKDKKCTTHLIGTKAGRFFQKQANFAGQLLNRANLSEYTNEFVRFLNAVHDYKGYFTGFSKFKQVASFKFPRALVTPVLFYALKAKGEILNVADLNSRLENIHQFYLKHYHDLHLMQAIHRGNEQKEGAIDMLIISKNPYDIAKMSAYADYAMNEWGSCLSPGGINSHYLPDEIGRGVFVVYGVNSKNPSQKLSRISVKPYVNEKGDVYFGPGYMYGLKIPAVQEALNAFLKPYQPKLRGAFSLQKGVYVDATTQDYYFNMDEYDILKHQGLDYYECVEGRTGVGNYRRKKVSLMSDGCIDAFFDTRPKVNVSTDGIDKDVTFSNMDIFGVFCCYYLTKERSGLLPYHTDELRLVSSNMRDLKGVDTRYFALDIHLANHLKSLDGISSWCSDVSLTRTVIETPYFKTPHKVQNFKGGLLTLKTDCLDFSDMTQDIELGECDLLGVKKIILPKKGNKVEFLFTKLPSQMSFDASGIKRFRLMPVDTIKINTFNISEKLTELYLSNVEFGDMDMLDLSHLNKVSFSKVSFENVQILLLPDEEKVSFHNNCKFPKGLESGIVAQNNGYGFSKRERQISSHQKTQTVIQNQQRHIQGYER